jgi:hypothetical protein
MLKRACLSLALLGAMPLWSQAPTSDAEPVAAQDDEIQMLTPPPVSGENYSIAVGSEVRSNYLDAGLIVNTSYDDNVLGGSGTGPVSDFTYSILPTVTLDQTTSRQHRTFTYSPGFTFYQRTSSLDAVDQNASLDFQYRLSRYVTASIRDSFQKSSNAFNQASPLLAGSISGSGPSSPGVIVPFAERLSNRANMELSYQFSRNGMIGASGIIEQLDYPNPSQVQGLYNSNSRGGSGFYSHRLSNTQYIGVLYQYLRSLAIPRTGESETQTHMVSSYYTIYLAHSFSLSLSGGPQYSLVNQSLLPSFHSWTPALTASVGWQGRRANVAANYSRTVTGGGGLLGAFNSNSANETARWRIAKAWTLGAGANYVINKSVSPLVISSYPGGHTVSGTALLEYSISEHIKAELGYARLHQSYSGITVISSNPDSDREYISVWYHFTRPLGR